MAKTITALFENYADANNAVQDLADHGFRRADISSMAHEALTDSDVRVREDETSGRAVSVLSKHHPLDIDRRIKEWRQSGWNRFDSNAEPYVPARRLIAGRAA